MLQEKLKQAGWQLPLMIITACILAIGTNQLRSEGIPLVGNQSEQARLADASGESLVIGKDEAWRLFQNKTALFLDARTQGQYAEGHIRGALNLPWQEADRYFMDLAERIDNAPIIITYCDGVHCDLSHKLALFLKKMGFENVRVLVNGWTVWQQAGLPTVAGGISP